jgi:hypothetical protein
LNQPLLTAQLVNREYFDSVLLLRP